VVYQGRLDGIVEDSFGWYWILEHKTAGQLGTTEYLQLDDQTGSYCWAIQKKLGIRVQGVIYNEAVKDFPTPPTQLVNARQGRNFSVNKMQKTTHDVYLKTLIEAKEDISLYEDFLNYLKLEGNPYFRRTQVHRNVHELENMGKYIRAEAEEMINPNLVMYPNPGKFNCSWCAFKEVCIAMNDGSDWQFILESNFRQREQEEIDARRARV
jgi:hypothetical protein